MILSFLRIEILGHAYTIVHAMQQRVKQILKLSFSKENEIWEKYNFLSGSWLHDNFKCTLHKYLYNWTANYYLIFVLLP